MHISELVRTSRCGWIRYSAPAGGASVFEQIGWFDEQLERSQDIEFSGRLRRAGGKILMSPEMKIDYYAQATLAGFLRQNWSNGVWAILPFAHVSGIAVRWRHLTPLALVLGLASSMIGGGVDRKRMAGVDRRGSLSSGQPGRIGAGGMERAQHAAGVPDAAGVCRPASRLWPRQSVGMRKARGAARETEAGAIS